MNRLMFERIPERPPEWDSAIRAFPGKTLFHETVWHEYLASIQPRGRIRYYALHSAGRVHGFFCALRTSKFGLPVLGSPLPGTGTNYMGPLADAEVSDAELGQSLVALARRERVAHLELASTVLDPECLERSGFNVHRSVTHLVPLGATEAAAWAELRSACRNRIKKAEKLGLVAETTDDPRIVDHFMEQYAEVYGKQGMVLPFGIERPRALWKHLHGAGRLLPIWVKHEGEVIAAGLFPFDERAVYFWGAASWIRHQHLCPNELLHWTVMREAVRRAIPAYNMCGGTSQFKDKFGGSDIPYNHYSRSVVPFLSTARGFYRRLHFQQLRLRGLLQARPNEPS